MLEHKRLLACALTGIFVAALCPGQALITFADNPIAQTVYTSDPAPLVVGDTVYVYTGHDKDGAENYEMPDWQLYSSKDMQNWRHHGTILSAEDFAWAQADSAWAAQCVERNGKYYYYVTLVPAETGGRAIGVAVADSPEGPFRDAIGKPLCGPNWDYIDPTVYIDDDGQAYLYFGNPRLYYVRLNEDMISYSGDIEQIEMTAEGFGTNGDSTMYTEGPWFYKRGGLYYMLYAAGGIPENISYSTATAPTGPWTFRGTIMPTEGGSFTNHCGVVDFKDKSYFFYHNGALPGGNGFQRSVAVEEFAYNPDGTFPEIKMSETGPEQIAPLNPYERVEAETFSWSEGVETETCADGTLNIGFLQDGDYVKLRGVDFGESAPKEFQASVSATESGSTVELRLDSLDGELIGTLEAPVTGDWQTYEIASTAVSEVTGQHDLYLGFHGSASYLLNMDWWKFTTGEPETVDGDADGNGVCDAADVERLLSYLLVKTTEIDAEAADLDSDGVLTAKDLTLLKRLVTGSGTVTPDPDPNPDPGPDVPGELPDPAEYMEEVRQSMTLDVPASATDSASAQDYGTVEHITYYSKTAEKEKGANVLLPPGYDSSKQYPVLYVNHGIFGDENSMLDDGMKIRTMAANLSASGEAVPMIIVFTSMFTSKTLDQCTGFTVENTICYDNFVYDIADSLMPYIEEHYPVKTGRENTALAGFSMGAREALYIGISRPDLFGYVGAACPAPGIVPATDQFMTHPGNMAESDFRMTDPLPYVLMIAGGTNDTVVGNFPEQYHDLFTANGTDHIWQQVPGGGHDGSVVVPLMYNFLKSLFPHLK